MGLAPTATNQHEWPMLTQKTRYALRALLYLIEEGHGDAVQLQRIADTQKIPRKFLELIMLDLKALGIVKSVRGPKGGYRLARHPQGISFGEVIRGLEGPIALVPCASVNFYKRCNDCHDEATCAIRRLFVLVRDRSLDVLNSVSLEDGARWELRLTEPSPQHGDPLAADWQI
jgi:Rrf2 family protein